MGDDSPTYTLINATPSPYGRKNSIAMYEKGINFEVRWEKPWEPETIVGDYSPLQQLPILLHGTSEKVAAYDSTYILDYLELMHPLPALMPATVEGKVLEKKLQMLGERLMEITATIFFEMQREVQSKPWMDRQRKKIETGLVEVAALIGDRAPAVDVAISLGDIALGTTLCLYEFEGVGMPIMPEFGWREKHPSLATYYDALIARPSFQKTVPIMFDTDLKSTV
jgi:glutathione S-transferase